MSLLKHAKGAAAGVARALDNVRGRRGSANFTSGSTYGRGITQPREGGPAEVQLGEGLRFDQHGGVTTEPPEAPLASAPGSPVRMTLLFDIELEVGPNGKLRLNRGTSLRMVDGKLEARPTSAEVSDATEGTVADGFARIAPVLAAHQALLDSITNAGWDFLVLTNPTAMRSYLGAVSQFDSRVPRYHGRIDLVAGQATINDTTITTADTVIVSRMANGGTPGNLTVTITNLTSFTISSDNALDTSNIAYLVLA